MLRSSRTLQVRIVGRVAQNEGFLFVQACLYLQIEKTFSKTVDKQKQKCYNGQADSPWVGEKYRKDFWKTFQKPLDKSAGVWYNSQAVRKKGGMESEARALRGSLTIEQQEIKVQAKACERISKFLWKRNLESITDSRHTQQSNKSQTSSRN